MVRQCGSEERCSDPVALGMPLLIPDRRPGLNRTPRGVMRAARWQIGHVPSEHLTVLWIAGLCFVVVTVPYSCSSKTDDCVHTAVTSVK